MTPIHLIGSTYCMPIPEDASAIVSHVAGGIQKIVFSSKIQDPAQCGGDMISLPPGNWQIICTTKECTETIAAKIVEKDGAFFKCYAGNRSHISPLRSLFCLMDERKCDLNKILLIIKKVS